MRGLTALVVAVVVASVGFTQEVPKQAEVLARVKALCERETKDKNLPALSIAIVVDQKVIYSAGFGHEDAKKTRPATAETVYRVGSVSKLFTDIAIMKLVEEKQIDLDAPVEKYLPTFKPKNQFNDTKLTLRMLMSHRSGLIRESPVGNYFDDTNPTLTASVDSINGIELIYKPGEKIKYSNAAIATVGRVLEVMKKKPFAEALKESTLDPLKMPNSSFVPNDAVKKHLAEAVMWSYHGREFPAPTFELGMAPAGSLYTTVGDLATFMSAVFGDRVLKPATMTEMFTPQFAKPEEKQGFGLGFMVGELEGTKRIGHGGAIYGFATEIALLPEKKLGVIVTCSRDVANGTTTRIADETLKLLLAAKAGKPLPADTALSPLKAEQRAALASQYVEPKSERTFNIEQTETAVYFWPGRGGLRSELRWDGTAYRADDCMYFGPPLVLKDKAFDIGGKIYHPQKPVTIPPAKPAKEFLGLIGEYGWDHNVLYIYEKNEKLYALIEWVCDYPLTKIDDNTFAFPDHGLYHGEKLVFNRDKQARATGVVAASVLFKRRTLDGESGQTFTVKPVKDIATVRAEALKATPPKLEGKFRASELVELSTVNKTIKFDIRYATKNNFLGTPFYTQAKAYIQKPAAEALGRVHKDLAERGYGLLVFDAYRPWHVTKMFWDATPEKFHNFVADPAKGSRHNRGCAVDLGLFDLKTGEVVEMVSGFDEFSDRAYPHYTGGTSLQRWHRDLLRTAMTKHGFTVYEAEWWHFDYKDWKEYDLGNETFEKLK